MSGLLSVEEAQRRILSVFHPVGVEIVPLFASADRILAEDIHAPEDLPAFDNSSMDGFAVLAEDVAGASEQAPVHLEIIADIPAGSADSPYVHSGQTARIMTGAPLPGGANAVVPVEDTNFAPGVAESQASGQVRIYRSVRVGTHVRPRGQDVRQGQHLLGRGRRLLPQDLGVLASVGRPEVRVYRRPQVAIFSSGDELVSPGKPLRPGQIYDSNQYVLAALLEQEGADVIRLGTAPDEPQAIEALLRKGVEQGAEMIVTSAGVSVGAFDFVREVIETHGQLNFWKVNMRPGKPLAFGAFEDIPLIGLPGNPVSSFVGCLVFVLPALYRLAGRAQPLLRRDRALTTDEIQSDGRESYLRATVQYRDGRPIASLTGHQGSGNLFSLVQANALLIVPSGVKSLPSGSEVEIWYFAGD